MTLLDALKHDVAATVAMAHEAVVDRVVGGSASVTAAVAKLGDLASIATAL